MADTDKTRPTATSQAQSGSDKKKDDEIQFFETTITKLVEQTNPDTGETETIEVLSDNLYPGEKLKRVDDEEKAGAKQEAVQKAAAKDRDAKAK
jgi:hypothetical protein